MLFMVNDIIQISRPKGFKMVIDEYDASFIKLTLMCKSSPAGYIREVIYIPNIFSVNIYGAYLTKPKVQAILDTKFEIIDIIIKHSPTNIQHTDMMNDRNPLASKVEIVAIPFHKNKKPSFFLPIKFISWCE